MSVAGTRNTSRATAPHRAFHPNSTDSPPPSSRAMAPARKIGTATIPCFSIPPAVPDQSMSLPTPLKRKMALRRMRPQRAASGRQHSAMVFLHTGRKPGEHQTVVQISYPRWSRGRSPPVDRVDDSIQVADMAAAPRQQAEADQVLAIAVDLRVLQGRLVLADPVILTLLQRPECGHGAEELGRSHDGGGEFAPRPRTLGRVPAEMPDPLTQDGGRLIVLVTHPMQLNGLRQPVELADHLVVRFDGRHLPPQERVQSVDIAGVLIAALVGRRLLSHGQPPIRSSPSRS